MNIEDYKKALFQLNELVRHLLIDSDDIQSAKQLKYWIDYWNKVESENQEVFSEVHKID